MACFWYLKASGCRHKPVPYTQIMTCWLLLLLLPLCCII
jgi:hypothetical protein